MKINTITCHDVYNHGASLQAYALMMYLSNQGHDVKIIDYKPDYLSNHYNLFSVDNPRYGINPFIKSVYLLTKLPFRLRDRKRKRSFDSFNKKHLNLTARYNDLTELQTSPPEADLYLCGSDQIWNTLHKNGKDPAFYLDFGSTDVRRASYAASLATNRIYDSYENFVKSKVNKLDYVACRESSGVEILSGLGIENVAHVMDPVLLLSEEEWNTIATGTFNEKYILIYDCENCQKLKNRAIQIANERDLKIYAVNPGKFDYVDKHYKNVGPDVFLSLIRDANVVISNSFHAVVFPLIFKTDFVIIHRSEALNQRMQDIFKTIDEKEAYIDSSIVSYNSAIGEVLTEKINFSKAYLQEIVS
jgi:hypothetical protein